MLQVPVIPQIHMSTVSSSSTPKSTLCTISISTFSQQIQDDTYHRVLILHKSHSWQTDTIAKEPLRCWTESLRFFWWYHEILILGLPVEPFAEEDSDSFTSLIGSGIPTTCVVRIAEEDQCGAWFQFCWDSLFIIGAT